MGPAKVNSFSNMKLVLVHVICEDNVGINNGYPRITLSSPNSISRKLYPSYPIHHVTPVQEWVCTGFPPYLHRLCRYSFNCTGGGGCQGLGLSNCSSFCLLPMMCNESSHRGFKINETSSSLRSSNNPWWKITPSAFCGQCPKIDGEIHHTSHP